MPINLYVIVSVVLGYFYLVLFIGKSKHFCVISVSRLGTTYHIGYTFLWYDIYLQTNI